MPFRFFIIKVFVILSFAGTAQPFTINGHVIDAESGQPLAFVNIVINQGNTGGVSDIDGRFAIKSTEAFESLQFSYVGYARLVHHVQNPDERLVIKMERLSLELSEVTIVAGDNPAHRIIENAIRHRDRNNYERLPSFSYTSYDKMILTIDADTIIITDSLLADTSLIKLKKFYDRQHAFIMESVSQRRFLYPGRNHHQVLASRVSGFRDPIFTFLISQLQSTSFYDDVISISDKNYVNPISRGSTTRYWFIIEDTMFMAGSPDTTFIISYRPRPNLNFDGLKGVLHINSNNWAIQNVIAAPARDEVIGVDVIIQQMYELVDSLYWFPVQLNTNMVFKNFRMNEYATVASGKSYITDIVVNPALVRRQFSEVNVDVDPNATYRAEEEWENWRILELTDKDLRTYHVLDSLGREHNLDRYALMFESLMSGNIPLGKFDIPMHRLFRYNKHEKVYLGIGLSTNQRISRVFNVGAYAGYGFGDDRFKYGGEVRLDFHRLRDLGWFFRLSNDVAETGKIDPFIAGYALGLSDYRNLLIETMDHTKTLATGMQYRIFPYLLVNLGLDRSWKSPQYDYFFTTTEEEPFPKAYVFTELGAGFRFSYREKILQTSRSRISLAAITPRFGSGSHKEWKVFSTGSSATAATMPKLSSRFTPGFSAKPIFYFAPE